ncbi:hypothetical protein [Amycolatopsis sp. NPDC059021]|uniref:hypothetical protein n=1 Tax=Amycolatopsis sp. NPDC059021 TaxID=3346704 RepID=UPI0036732044
MLHTRPDEPGYEEMSVGSPELDAAKSQAELWLSLRYIDELSATLEAAHRPPPIAGPGTTDGKSSR